MEFPVLVRVVGSVAKVWIPSGEPMVMVSRVLAPDGSRVGISLRLPSSTDMANRSGAGPAATFVVRPRRKERSEPGWKPSRIALKKKVLSFRLAVPFRSPEAPPNVCAGGIAAPPAPNAKLLKVTVLFVSLIPSPLVSWKNSE
jgi:hypothetical protein